MHKDDRLLEMNTLYAQKNLAINNNAICITGNGSIEQYILLRLIHEIPMKAL